MKNLTMLVWFTQLGLSVAVPPVGFVLLALWLRDRWGWGGWVLWAGVALGVLGAFFGLRDSLRAMERLARDRKQEKPPLGFNDHS